jgi:hypothetical protein
MTRQAIVISQQIQPIAKYAVIPQVEEFPEYKPD